MPNKDAGESIEELKKRMGFVKENIHDKTDAVQKQVIRALGFIWSFKKPPQELNDEILEFKIMLMDSINGKNDFKERSAGIKKFAANVLWDCVSDYALKCIHDKAKSYVNTGNPAMNKDNIDSMMSEMWLATGQYIDRYDPKRAAPITFLKQCFYHGIFDWKKWIYSIGSNNGTTGLTKRVDNVIHELEDEGYEVTIANIHARIPAFPLDQIQTAFVTLEAKNNMASTENCTELLESQASHIPTPEEAAETNERDNMFYAAVHALPDDQKAVYCLVAGISLEDDEVCNKPLSKREVAKMAGITESEVSALVIKAQNSIFMKMTGHRRCERFSPNHTETKKCRASCDKISFINENDDFVADEIAAETTGAEEFMTNPFVISEEDSGQMVFVSADGQAVKPQAAMPAPAVSAAAAV